MLIEDNPGDARLIQEILKEAPGNFTIKIAEKLGSGLKVLLSEDVDVVLLDLGLPDSRGLETLTRLQARLPHLPVVIMTSIADEAIAVQAVQMGAQDYLTKGQIDSGLLRRALLYAIERKRAEEALRQRTLELQHLTETLEQQVRERTEELEVTNEELRNQIEECQSVEIALKKSETSLRHLSVELLNSQEKERKLVAGEIHDSIGSSLAAIKFKVDNVITEVGEKGPETTTPLRNLIPIVQGAIDEARRIQMNLRPSILDDLGILATIKWFCRQFESTYSKIRISQRIKVEEHEVPAPLRTVIFRVLQEGLNNVAKHSEAKMVMLLLRKTGQRVQLVIQDNGQGFDVSKAQSPDNTARGLGLNSMRERTELSGGSFEIESTQGKGTTIRASWPI